MAKNLTCFFLLGLRLEFLPNSYHSCPFHLDTFHSTWFHMECVGEGKVLHHCGTIACSNNFLSVYARWFWHLRKLTMMTVTFPPFWRACDVQLLNWMKWYSSATVHLFFCDISCLKFYLHLQTFSICICFTMFYK